MVCFGETVAKERCTGAQAVQEAVGEEKPLSPAQRLPGKGHSLGPPTPGHTLNLAPAPLRAAPLGKPLELAKRTLLLLESALFLCENAFDV